MSSQDRISHDELKTLRAQKLKANQKLKSSFRGPGAPLPPIGSPSSPSTGHEHARGFFSQDETLSASPRTLNSEFGAPLSPSSSMQPSAASFSAAPTAQSPSASGSAILKTLAAGQQRRAEPKVMIPFQNIPGHVPRKVEIERRRRLYESMDLEAILLEKGIDCSVPPSQPAYLPLDAFDNSDFDCRLPSEWVEVEQPACALDWDAQTQTGHWVHGTVVAYDAATQRYRVRVKDSADLVVPRIHCYFKTEDPSVFAERFLTAHRARAHAESMLRLHLYIDNMPTDDIPPMGEHQVAAVLRLAFASPKLVAMQQRLSIQQLVDEASVEYARCMNRIVFDESLRDPAQADVFASLQLPEPEPAAPVPEFAMVQIPPHPFVDNFKAFSFATYLVPEVVRALQAVRNECIRASTEKLFAIELPKTVRVDEFEQVQTSAANQCLAFLRENWIHVLKTGVKQAMRGIGKGWLNLQEQSRETYEMSKLRRLMTAIRFMMEDALRDLVRYNAERFAAFIEHQFGFDIEVIGAGDMLCTPHKLDNVPVRPLFAVDLVEQEGEFRLSTPAERFVEVPVQCFLKNLGVLRDVPHLEQHVMDQFFWPSVGLLSSPDAQQEPHLVAAKERIAKAIDRCVFALNKYIEAFAPYQELARIKPADYIVEYEAQEHDIQDMQAEVQKHLARKSEVLQRIQASVVIGPFLMDLKTIRMQLSRKCDEMVRLVLDLIAKHARTRVKEVQTQVSEISTKLQRRPKNIEEVVELEEFKKTVPALVNAMQPALTAIRTDTDILDKFLYAVSDEDVKGVWSSLAVPSRLERIVEGCDEVLKESRDSFAAALQKDQDTLSKEIERLQRVVSTFSKHTELSRVHEVAAEVKHLLKEIKKCEEAAKLANSREGLFGKSATEYDAIGAINKEFDPYAQLWTAASDWTKWYHDWMHDPFESLNSEEIDRNVNNSWRIMFKSIKVFKEQPKILAVAEEIKKQLDEFKPFLPLIQSLRQAGMRQRHWDALSAKLDMLVLPGENGTIRTLQDVFDMRLHEKTADITEICDVAGKEYNIERALDKMCTEWEPINFEVLPYKETGTFVIRGSDEINQMLDDHIVMTQSMSFSAFKKPFEERIAKWETELRLCSDILEEWLMCQRNWLYLEPIFSSDDIMRQLPMEGKRFATVDRMWRKIMGGASKTPHVMTYCTKTAKLLDNFQECNKLLDLVQKGLNDYLETKRQAFARFYFLSNDELLEILSQTREPRAVQKHLRKCFEAIAKLEFQADDGMTHMYSSEGEVVPFAEKIYPKGSVEEWLNVVERMMCESIRQQIERSVADYLVTPRTEWVQKWPGQVVLIGSQIYWTRECGEAIATKGTQGVRDYYHICHQQLLDIAAVVRNNLPGLARITIGALITIDVHARDVVQTMADSGVSQITDFEWISQMRYEWDGRDAFVKQVESVFKYGYEYLGNTSRLVITPLTDRIYLTLTSALSMYLGGAPAGPAGTGKTETVKDLAKALAKQCVVFNCQEGLDYLAMGKFFKGLAMAGAWACFDEFNRIDVEVLSVVAQQMITLTQALRQHVERIVFEGTEIRVDESFAVFITMNPGYAGRTELPDNLKALFRPVACMVPDYALIAEIRLFSFGFRDAKKLAQKMVATFRLSSEQLSSQDHYDFGMRAVNTVISAAGLLKREEPDMQEDLLLLRALRDSNLPKFLADDIVLFNGIISDLFPGVELPQADYGALLVALKESIKELGLQPVDMFITKCIQLFETTVLRHGLMLVGPTGSGKTCARKVLAKAQGKVQHLAKFDEVMIRVCNPKSITMGQLYGQFDEATHEWTDGILATLYRECAYDTTERRKWLIFDGPVDALWIESMNTVLDDNKKLCLVSGEIIPMSKKMNVVFEVEDLAVASPATVSRCGMVYMEPSTSVGNAALVTSWLDALPETIAEHRGKFQELFDAYLTESLKFTRRNLREYVATVDNNLVCSLFRLLDSFLYPLRPRPLEDYKPAKDRLDAFPPKMEPMFIFALLWSVGGGLDRSSRPKFDQFLRDLMRKNKAALQFPKNGLCYDYSLDLGESLAEGSGDDDGGDKGGRTIGRGPIQWKNWIDTIPPFVLDPKLRFSDIIVPTTDSIRYAWLLEHLLTKGKHVLCVGPTGTGKSLTIADKLMKGMPEKFIPQFLAFSAQTSANQTQDIIDGKLDKRRKGIYGPPSGKQYLLFVDDVNMPAREEYGAQPPIELLRQFLDHGGWYDRAKFEFRHIVDMTIVGAMGPPGGGRNPVTNRFLRHFNFVSFPEMEDDSMKRIFSTILSTFLNNNNFVKEVTNLADPLVDMSVVAYNTILAELLPTPVKSHYTFNLRDLAKVVQGMMSADPKKIADPADLVRIWSHECSRVFRDRLVDNEDRVWFDKLLGEEIKKKMKLDWQRDIMNVQQLGRIVYCDFLNMDTRSYEQVQDITKLQRIIEEALDDYNNSAAGMNKPMKLVMFVDAMEHVCRISRILRQPGGNALLLGVGGSGRQSLARVAAFISEYPVFQIEIAKGYGKTEWRNDLKKVLLKAGVENKACVFLFSDTQIVKESFLEDINNLLNAGEVPNIMEPADMDAIYSALQPVCQGENIMPTKINMYARFIKRCKENMHVVLAFSPIGEAFRTRLRMFPALVNCCTIDWFSEWPDQALRSVAASAFEDTPLGDEHVQKCVVDMCVAIHQSVERASRRYLVAERRYNYVTPTSYLQLLSTFKRVLSLKREEVAVAKKRLVVGLDKLEATEKDVAVLKDELTEMQPVLIETSRQVEEMMVQIAKDKADADETRKVVLKEEQDANAKAKECKEIKESAQRELDEALPALDAALSSLKSLKVSDIQEVAAYKTPPAGVKLVMEAICILKGLVPKMVGEAGKKTADYWEPSVKLLKDAKGLLDSFFAFDKDNIPEAVVKKIQPYIESPDFVPDKIRKVSTACTSMCQWCHAMYKYHFVSKGVEPKRQALAAAEAELTETMDRLNRARATLKGVEEKIAELEVKYTESVNKKDELGKKVRECEVKMDRAGRLIGGLGGEKVRWKQTVAKLSDDERAVIGDVLVAAGAIAYLGAFTASFRSDMYKEWATALDKVKIYHTADVRLATVVGDPVKTRDWTIKGLPTDALSVENGIVLSKSTRWPLLIDPQGQANKWIKNTEKDAGLEVLKLTDEQMLRSLENAVRFGKPVLIENVGESLPASLEPILLRETFKQGGSEMIKLGDSVVPYHPDFRLYITTKLRNPHYSPETCVKVTLLNFLITPDGLEDQLLGIVVAKERPDLEEMKNQLVISNARMKKELKTIEDEILRMLSESSGDILDDEALINTLAKSKETSVEINAKVAEAEATEKQIDVTREGYRPVAFRASILFFCVADMATVDPMYQYSLQWFIRLFVNAIDSAEKPAVKPEEEALDDAEKESLVLQRRLVCLNDYFTYSLYLNICRSLFEKHKLLFSFLLATRILQGSGKIVSEEYRFLLTGGTSTETADPNPAPEWLSPQVWAELHDLEKIPVFEGFIASFKANIEHYREYFESATAHRCKLAADIEPRMDMMKRLMVLRVLRADKVVEGVQDFVTEHLGVKFIEPPPFDLPGSFADSSPTVPLIFVLSAGADPGSELFRFAEERGMMKKLSSISLGQGQGPLAERLIGDAAERGGWVLLQNCHLATSWMPSLERIVENFVPEKMHRDFRLFLTSMPSEKFPQAVLQNSVKMTNEPPKGLRANLRGSYVALEQSFFDECTKPQEFRKLLFALCFFHAQIQERRKFGPLGWNIRYEFTNGDLQLCMRQLSMFLDKYEEIPFKVLRFLFGQINYGGRVTDDWDRRLLLTMQATSITAEALTPGYKFSDSGIYHTLLGEEGGEPDTKIDDYLDYISKKLPINPAPEVFGLHENADITCAQAETREVMEIILSLQPRTSGGAGSMTREQIIEATAKEILEKVPDAWNVMDVMEKYPTSYGESMNTVLVQEVIRYNKLLVVMKKSLADILKALKGLVVMSGELEAMGTSLFNNQVPKLWASKAYPSLKGLSAWVQDLLLRLDFISSWYKNGIPNVYWMSGFFFPQAAITAVMQNYARKHKISIDTVAFGFEVTDYMQPSEVAKGPEDGAYMRGLFLEGARWDMKTKVLEELHPRQLFVPVPIIWFKPIANRVKPAAGTVYECPVYKTVARAGTLSTTGHSTNYVLTIELPTKVDPSIWIRRGTACFCALAY